MVYATTKVEDDHRHENGRVAAGAIAKKILSSVAGVEIVGYVKRIQDLEGVDPNTVTLDQVEIVCPDSECAEQMIERVSRWGGRILSVAWWNVARKVPKGLGSPVFDKLEADIAKGVMSLPATKGFEIGSGFAGTDWE